MEKVFFAFGGHPNENLDLLKITDLGEGCYLYNLKQFDSDSLTSEINSKEVVLKHLELKIPKFSKEFLPCWGMLLSIEGIESDFEYLFFIELFCGKFLNPLFSISRLGYVDSLIQLDSNNRYEVWKENCSKLIQNGNIVDFLKKLQFGASIVGWKAIEIGKWLNNSNIEQFRVYSALNLYGTLKKYSYGKSPDFWIKEIADIVTVFEILFTEENEKDSIGYILRKRIHLLIGDSISNVEFEIKKAYDTRSNFVHGSFFTTIKKNYNVDTEGYARHKVNSKMFDDTEKYELILKRIIITYLYIHISISLGKFDTHFLPGEKKSVIILLEKSVFDDVIRNFLNSERDTILSLVQ